MVQHIFTRFAALACNHIQHAFGQQMVDFLGKRQQAQRSAARWVNHNGAARRQRRRNFPSCHQKREIPRNNLPHYTNRFAQHQRQIFFVQLVGGAFFAANHAGEIAEMVGSQRNIGGTGFAYRLAVVQRFLQREQFGIFVNHIGDLVQDGGALGGGGFFPCFKRFLRGGNGCVHIGIGGIGKFCQLRAVGGVVGSE